jgi:23S rRNA pseudouridine2605 synthase
VPPPRLQKVLAQAGIASRRQAETLITSGRVTVDGRVVTELGTRADPETSVIELDGRRIAAEARVYLVFHKPRNVVSTMHDPEGRPTVAEYMKRIGERVVPIGRLDFHTSGTLLLTNDGEFVDGLLHPRTASPKVYVAKVRGLVNDEDLDRWQEPIEIDGRATRPAEVHRLRFEEDKTWLEITLKEGKNRQIHRLGEATGFPVLRLARLSFAGIDSEGLRPGAYRHLTREELFRLRRDYGVPKQIPEAPRQAGPAGERSEGAESRRRRPASSTSGRSGPRPAPDSLPRPVRPPRPRGPSRTR